jgi:hypothetical protein
LWTRWLAILHIVFNQIKYHTAACFFEISRFLRGVKNAVSEI